MSCNHLLTKDQLYSSKFKHGDCVSCLKERKPFFGKNAPRPADDEDKVEPTESMIYDDTKWIRYGVKNDREIYIEFPKTLNGFDNFKTLFDLDINITFKELNEKISELSRLSKENQTEFFAFELEQLNREKQKIINIFNNAYSNTKWNSQHDYRRWILDMFKTMSQKNDKHLIEVQEHYLKHMDKEGEFKSHVIDEKDQDNAYIPQSIILRFKRQNDYSLYSLNLIQELVLPTTMTKKDICSKVDKDIDEYSKIEPRKTEYELITNGGHGIALIYNHDSHDGNAFSPMIYSTLTRENKTDFNSNDDDYKKEVLAKKTIIYPNLFIIRGKIIRELACSNSENFIGSIPENDEKLDSIHNGKLLEIEFNGFKYIIDISSTEFSNIRHFPKLPDNLRIIITDNFSNVQLPSGWYNFFSNCKVEKTGAVKPLRLLNQKEEIKIDFSNSEIDLIGPSPLTWNLLDAPKDLILSVFGLGELKGYFPFVSITEKHIVILLDTDFDLYIKNQSSRDFTIRKLKNLKYPNDDTLLIDNLFSTEKSETKLFFSKISDPYLDKSSVSDFFLVTDQITGNSICVVTVNNIEFKKRNEAIMKLFFSEDKKELVTFGDSATPYISPSNEDKSQLSDYYNFIHYVKNGSISKRSVDTRKFTVRKDIGYDKSSSRIFPIIMTNEKGNTDLVNQLVTGIFVENENTFKVMEYWVFKSMNNFCKFVVEYSNYTKVSASNSETLKSISKSQGDVDYLLNSGKIFSTKDIDNLKKSTKSEFVELTTLLDEKFPILLGIISIIKTGFSSIRKFWEWYLQFSIDKVSLSMMFSRLNQMWNIFTSSFISDFSKSKKEDIHKFQNESIEDFFRYIFDTIMDITELNQIFFSKLWLKYVETFRNLIIDSPIDFGVDVTTTWDYGVNDMSTIFYEFEKQLGSIPSYKEKDINSLDSVRELCVILNFVIKFNNSSSISDRFDRSFIRRDASNFFVKTFSKSSYFQVVSYCIENHLKSHSESKISYNTGLLGTFKKFSGEEDELFLSGKKKQQRVDEYNYIVKNSNPLKKTFETGEIVTLIRYDKNIIKAEKQKKNFISYDENKTFALISEPFTKLDMSQLELSAKKRQREIEEKEEEEIKIEETIKERKRQETERKKQERVSKETQKVNLTILEQKRKELEEFVKNGYMTARGAEEALKQRESELGVQSSKRFVEETEEISEVEEEEESKAEEIPEVEEQEESKTEEISEIEEEEKKTEEIPKPQEEESEVGEEKQEEIVIEPPPKQETTSLSSEEKRKILEKVNKPVEEEPVETEVEEIEETSKVETKTEEITEKESPRPEKLEPTLELEPEPEPEPEPQESSQEHASQQEIDYILRIYRKVERGEETQAEAYQEIIQEFKFRDTSELINQALGKEILIELRDAAEKEKKKYRKVTKEEEPIRELPIKKQKQESYEEKQNYYKIKKLEREVEMLKNKQKEEKNVREQQSKEDLKKKIKALKKKTAQKIKNPEYFPEVVLQPTEEEKKTQKKISELEDQVFLLREEKKQQEVKKQKIEKQTEEKNNETIGILQAAVESKKPLVYEEEPVQKQLELELEQQTSELAKQADKIAVIASSAKVEVSNPENLKNEDSYSVSKILNTFSSLFGTVKTALTPEPLVQEQRVEDKQGNYRTVNSVETRYKVDKIGEVEIGLDITTRNLEKIVGILRNINSLYDEYSSKISTSYKNGPLDGRSLIQFTSFTEPLEKLIQLFTKYRREYERIMKRFYLTPEENKYGTVRLNEFKLLTSMLISIGGLHDVSDIHLILGKFESLPELDEYRKTARHISQLLNGDIGEYKFLIKDTYSILRYFKKSFDYVNNILQQMRIEEIERRKLEEQTIQGKKHKKKKIEEKPQVSGQGVVKEKKEKEKKSSHIPLVHELVLLGSFTTGCALAQFTNQLIDSLSFNYTGTRLEDLNIPPSAITTTSGLLFATLMRKIGVESTLQDMFNSIVSITSYTFSPFKRATSAAYSGIGNLFTHPIARVSKEMKDNLKYVIDEIPSGIAKLTTKMKKDKPDKDIHKFHNDFLLLMTISALINEGSVKDDNRTKYQRAYEELYGEVYQFSLKLLEEKKENEPVTTGEAEKIKEGKQEKDESEKKEVPQSRVDLYELSSGEEEGQNVAFQSLSEKHPSFPLADSYEKKICLKSDDIISSFDLIIDSLKRSYPNLNELEERFFIISPLAKSDKQLEDYIIGHYLRITDAKIIFIPIHSEEQFHWTLEVFDKSKKISYYYDSVKHDINRESRESRMDQVKKIFKDRAIYDEPLARQTMAYEVQDNSHGCGYFVINTMYQTMRSTIDYQYAPKYDELNMKSVLKLLDKEYKESVEKFLKE